MNEAQGYFEADKTEVLVDQIVVRRATAAEKSGTGVPKTSGAESGIQPTRCRCACLNFRGARRGSSSRASSIGAQGAAQDFADIGFWKFGAKLDSLGNFVTGKP